LEAYCKKKNKIKKNQAFKILLITDNFQVTQEQNIKEFSFSHLIIPLLQLMDQGQTHYSGRTFAKLREATDGEDKPSVKELKKIKDEVHVITEA
jgi:hypothetical protein